MAANPVRIHSVAEAYLLLMVTPCEACGKGPLQSAGHEAAETPGLEGRRLTAKCQACEHEQVFLFDLTDVRDGYDEGRPETVRINPTAEPSRAIDLAQWLMLFESIVRAADQQTDAGESRRLGYEAAQCLEEALKFYPAGSDEWPLEGAFFQDATLARYRQHKHLFARTRLIDLRRKLPTLTRMEAKLSDSPAAAPARKRSWWAFWR